MAKAKARQPLVTSVSETLKASNITTTKVTTEDETKARKSNMIAIADKALELFKKNLEDGKVELRSTLDLDRISRLLLLLSGEAESLTASETTVSAQASVDMSKATQILDVNDPKVKELYEQLYLGYNKANDEVEDDTK